MDAPPTTERELPTPTPRRRRRVLVAALAPALAVAAYVGLHLGLPGFAEYTRDGLRGLGLSTGVRDPGVRAPIVDGEGRYLWGGPDPDDRFDITEFRLEPGGLRYGLGRERFPALIEPAFVPVSAFEADRLQASIGLSASGRSVRVDLSTSTRWPGDRARVLLVRIGDDVRIYPFALLRRHEVVNDVVGGRPVFAAYCYLADLAAMYDRRHGDRTLTFAVSGYTYRDRIVWGGRDAFVLWDRDTESLWWPPIGRAVSGPLIDGSLTRLEPPLWESTTWGDARRRHPDARVLAPGQTMTPPEVWPPPRERRLGG